MVNFKRHLEEEKWKKSKKVSPRTAKIIPKRSYWPEIEYTFGKWTIVKVGSENRVSAKRYLIINPDGKLVMTRNGGTYVLDKLTNAKYWVGQQ